MSNTLNANQEAVRRLLISRLKDYEGENNLKLQARLVEQWHKAHPDAAKEESRWLHPLARWGNWTKTHPDDPDEQWFNDIYFVAVRRHKKDPVFGSSGGMIQLGIASMDGTARHDWRDMQAIKSQIAGAECEAFELYPAESRVLDPSNHYSLWCFPGVKRLKIGQPDRRVYDVPHSFAPQRALAKPPAADESDTRLLAILKQIERDSEKTFSHAGIPHVAELARQAAELLRTPASPGPRDVDAEAIADDVAQAMEESQVDPRLIGGVRAVVVAAVNKAIVTRNKQ